MKNKIYVSLESKENVTAILNYILSDYEGIAKDSYDNSGLEIIDIATGDEFVLASPVHAQIPNYSELAFYTELVKDSYTHALIVETLQENITKNATKVLRMNDEIPMGLSAAFALAYHDKKYISLFVDFLRTLNLNYEVLEPFFIDALITKWQIISETLYLIAARTCSISGQWSLETLTIPKLNKEEKNQYLNFLLADALHAKAVYPDILLETMATLEIPINAENFTALFSNYKPIYNQSNISSITVN